MSTATSSPLAFRCNTCWHNTFAESDQVGQEVPCRKCGENVLVPEATPDRLELGPQIAEEYAEAPVEPEAENLQELSEAQLYKKVWNEVKSSTNIGNLAAPLWKRFIGRMIDDFLTVVMFGIGFVVALMVYGPEAENAGLGPLVFIYGIPLMFCITNWMLTATEGRTIGKYCVNTKVVNNAGGPPGFVQGVLLRNWVVLLLNLIPFFGLLDAAVIFANEQKRCIHDMLAGTLVVDA